MTESEQQAKEIFQDFEDLIYATLTETGDGVEAKELAIECALKAVNKVIGSIRTQPSKSETERLDATMFWIKVQEEIKKFKP